MGILTGTFVDSDGRIEERNVLVDREGRIVSIDSQAIPRFSITPEVGGGPRASQLWDGGSDQTIYDWRYTVNAGDEFDAGERLLNGFPDVGVLIPGDSIIISTDMAITRLDLVGNGSAATHSAAGGTILIGTSTEANARAAMQTFTFDAADDTRTVIITAGNLFGSARYGRTHVEGRSHA